MDAIGLWAPERINPAWVVEQVEAIRGVARDYEDAHSREDSLWSLVLHKIAHDQADEPHECARVALTTKDIEFPRYCA